MKKGSILAIDDIEYKASVGKAHADVSSNNLAALTSETDANFIEQLQRLLNVSTKSDQSAFDLPADFQPIPNANLNENSNIPTNFNGTGVERVDPDDSPAPEQQKLKIPPLPLFDPLGTFNAKIQEQNSGGAADDDSTDRMCQLASCDFNVSDRLCNYIDATKIGDAKWAFSISRVGNRLTGINADASGKGGFVYTLSPDQVQNISSHMAVLQSPKFEIRKQGVLQFRYYLPGRTGRISVCDGTPENCLWDHTNTDGNISPLIRNWKLAEVQLNKGVHQLFFTATNLYPHSAAGLDDIVLMDNSKHGGLECFEVHEDIIFKE